MAKDSSIGTLVTLGVLGVGGYYVYSKYFSSPATVAIPAALPAALLPGGSVGGVSTGSTQVDTSVTTGGAPGSDVTGVTNNLQVSSGGGPGGVAPRDTSVAQGVLYRQLIAAIGNDTNFTGSGDSLSGTPDHFNFYLSRILNAPAPDPLAVFPDVDRTQPMSIQTYWAGVAPAIQPSGSLSGLLAGLGQLLAGETDPSSVFAEYNQAPGALIDANMVAALAQNQPVPTFFSAANIAATPSGQSTITSWLNQNSTYVLIGGGLLFALALIGGRR